jgi:hypothetical protein
VSRSVSTLRYVPELGGDAFGYWAALSELWERPVTVVNVEWDMEYSDQLARQLNDCPHPVCTHAYRVYPGASTRLPEPVWAHQVSTVGLSPPIPSIVNWCARGCRWLADGDEWADFGGIGFLKVTPEGRSGSLRRDTWRGVEMSVAASLTSRIHVHWPGVKHYHQEEER